MDIKDCNEQLLSLTQAARAVPAVDGKRPHPSTVFRWMTDGIRGGVKLEHIRVGRRICTTKSALERFFQATADAPAPIPTPRPQAKPKGRTEAQRRHDLAQAEERLRAAGAL